MLLPTIHFSGNCLEAIEFYKKTVGAEVVRLFSSNDAPPEVAAQMPPNFVMFSEIKMLGATVSLTDGCEEAPNSINFTYTVVLDTAEEVTDVFNRLAEGGTITEPLGQQFWADLSGMLTDKFGVNWNILTKTMP